MISRPDNFLKGICFFQRKLFLGVSLIYMKNSIDSRFSNKFYILYHAQSVRT